MNNTYGVSNVIGALMLTLVVVSAATAFAVFTQQKQDEIQKSEFAKLEKELEEITVVSMENPIYSGLPSKLDNVTFVIANIHTKDTKITTLRINNFLILGFMIQRMDLSKERWDINTTTGVYSLTEIYDEAIPGWMPATENPDLKIKSKEQITLTIENTSTEILKQVTEEIFENDAINFEIVTSLTNTFPKSFMPPTSIIQVTTESQWDPSIPGYANFLIFDGSLSDHPGDGYIKTWTWLVTEHPGGTGDGPTTLTGRKVRAPNYITDGDTYDIDLNVEDNYGMKGNSILTYP
jgi:hypothetical protein